MSTLNWKFPIFSQALSVLVFTPRSREAENKILAKEDENLSLK